MVDSRSVSERNLSDRVGEVMVVANADITLDYRRAGVLRSDDQIARMRDRLTLALGNEQQMDGLFDDGVRLDLYERAVPNERRVQSGECMVVERRDLGEMALGTPNA